jgi:hypothetical protein
MLLAGVALPEGLVYYTPSLDTPGYPSPEVSRTFTDSARAKAFIVRLMVYDEKPQEVEIVRVESEPMAMLGGHKTPEKSLGYLH